MMTKRDFENIADALRAARDGQAFTPNEVDRLAALDMAADEIANVCAGSNPRFDRARFLTAAGAAHIDGDA